MAQYSENGSSSFSAGDYASLPDYYSNQPLMGTGITVVQMDPSNKPWLNETRTKNVRSNGVDPVYRSGYATLSGYQNTNRGGGRYANTWGGANNNSNPGSGNSGDSNSNYFTLGAAYKTR